MVKRLLWCFLLVICQNLSLSAMEEPELLQEVISSEGAVFDEQLQNFNLKEWINNLDDQMAEELCFSFALALSSVLFENKSALSSLHARWHLRKFKNKNPKAYLQSLERACYESKKEHPLQAILAKKAGQICGVNTEKFIINACNNLESSIQRIPFSDYHQIELPSHAPSKLFTACHEFGHYALGHTSVKVARPLIAYFLIDNVISLAARTCLSYNVCSLAWPQHNDDEDAATKIANGCKYTILGTLGEVAMRLMWGRLTRIRWEKQADLFACQKLATAEKYDEIKKAATFFQKNHSPLEITGGFTHPSHKERARYINRFLEAEGKNK